MLRSRVVAWLRVLLPLAALAILSTLFLLGRKPDPDAAIPYATIDAEDLASDPRMTRPQYAGVTESGAAITLTAARASPNPADEGEAQSVRLTWRAPDGLAADLTAPRVAMESGRINLSGGVRMTTSDGWALSLPQITADTARDHITGAGGLSAFAPMGRLSAKRLELTRDASGQHLLILSGGVRLLYQP